MDTITHGLAGASIGVVASSLIGDGSMQVALIASTTIAALLPDLDYIFALINKPLLAWRWHRVIFHNVFIFPFIALLVALGVQLFSTTEIPLLWLVGLNFAALLSHIFLDLLTSFGTAIFYPLSTKRYAWGTHFLTDPMVGIILAISLFPSLTWWALLGLAVYLLFSVALKWRAWQLAKRQRDAQGLSAYPVYIRPRTFAPWQWLAVIVKENEYAFFYLSPFHVGSMQTTSRGLDTQAANLVDKEALMSYFLSISDFPRYEDTERDGQPAIVVEDIQWWWKLPYRPMAISAILDDHGRPSQVRESKKFSTSPTG